MVATFIQKLLSLFDSHLVQNVNRTTHAKNALLCYITAPFLPQLRRTFAHQNHSQIRDIAEILGSLGYNVDVMNYWARSTLSKNYDLVIDIHPDENKVYWSHLHPAAKKIVYYTGSYPEFQNKAEQKRLMSIKKRKGVQLQAQRQVPPIAKQIWERFDAVLLMGNARTQKTFPEMNVPIQLIPNTGDEHYPRLSNEQKSTKSFLFLASGGQVHKGLDLLLEVFSKHPELELTICSPFMREKDFTELYSQELFQTPNIHPIGFLDPYSKKFQEIAKKCVYMVSPSASEGMSGSVLIALSVGLIPIVSQESGVDGLWEFSECSLVNVEKTIVQASKKNPKSSGRLPKLYTTTSFRKQVKEKITQIISG